MATFTASNNGLGLTANVAWFFRQSSAFTNARVGWVVNGPGITNGTIQAITPDPNDADTIFITVEIYFSFTAGAGYTFSAPVACFVEGTRVLTQNGYKAIETLTDNDRVQTSDKRFVNFKLTRTNIEKTDVLTAPYKIEPGAFGKNIPKEIIRLSPTHKILIRKGVWTSPEWATQINERVKQYGIGEPVTYYHIECDNYLKDNLVTEGLIVESFGTQKSAKGLKDIYKWSTKLNGFTRIAYKCNV